MKSAEIREAFLRFFEEKGHTRVASSSLIPANDPTLLFTNAGMNQFKDCFLGLEKRAYTRATTSQKCVRAGGKHNDLENVGYTARHHTFFEMLGNFSFGDYFKDGAIPFAWELLTKDFGIPKDKLLVTVYHTDDEAANIWKKVAGLTDDRIIRIPTSDNFWQMGPTGPCGPCTEIFFDHGDKIWGGPPGSADEDGDRFIEIWNLVFMQNEQFEDGSMRALDMQSIDTGMGLERIGALLQGKHDNYDTDLMRALIEASANATNSDPDGPGKVHHRVIADHLRSTSFLIADGVMPSNEGRGYVLRRIMRRAMRHAHMLGATDPVMHRLVPALVRQMGAAYPELTRAQALIEETLRSEETRFRQTLDRGLRLLDDELARLPEGADLPGEAAFKLYDTYGFPLDLTQDALREQGRSVDTAGFDAAMAEQKAKARAAWSGSGDAKDAAIWLELAEKHGWFLARQFETEANADIHEATTAQEILGDFAGQRLDYIVTGYGTGGTVTGLSRVLRRERPEVKIILTEPANAALVSSGIPQDRGADHAPAVSHPAFEPHPIQGWTPDFIPYVLQEALDKNGYDELIPIPGAEGMDWARKLAAKEGILTGVSGGSTFAVAMRIAERAEPGTVILSMMPDTGERYLSTPLFEQIGEDMNDEERALSESTPGYRLG